MTRWEYTVRDLPADVDPAQALTAYGHEGWEAWALGKTRLGDNTVALQVWLKRPAPAPMLRDPTSGATAALRR